MNPLTEPVPRSEHHAGDRHDRAEQRQPDERAGAGRPGDPALDLPSARPRRRAAVRHGLRPDRTPADRASRRRRPVFRSSVGQRRVRAGAEPAGEDERSRSATASCRRSAPAASPPKRRRRCRSTSTTARCPSSCAVECRHRRSRCPGRPWSTSCYVGQHGYNIVEGINLNGVDFGTAFLPQNQDPTLAPTTPGATSLPSDQMRAFRGYSGDHAERQPRLGHAPLAAALVQPPLPQRSVVRLQRHDRPLELSAASAARLQHNPDGTVTYRADQAEADDALPDAADRHTMKGNFVWDLPDLRATAPALRAIGLLINDWQFSGVWTASTASAVHRRLQLPERRRQREPHRLSRLRGANPPRSAIPVQGCSSDLYRQFNTAAFARAAGRQRRPRVGHRLSPRLLLAGHSTCRLPGISGCPAAGPSSSAPTCSMPSTAPASPAGTRRCSSTRPRDPITNVAAGVRSRHRAAERRRQPDVDRRREPEPVAAEERRVRRGQRVSRLHAASRFRSASRSEVRPPGSGTDVGLALPVRQIHGQEITMTYTRRDFGKIALAGLPAAGFLLESRCGIRGAAAGQAQFEVGRCAGRHERAVQLQDRQLHDGRRHHREVPAAWRQRNGAARAAGRVVPGIARGCGGRGGRRRTRGRGAAWWRAAGRRRRTGARRHRGGEGAPAPAGGRRARRSRRRSGAR